MTIVLVVVIVVLLLLCSFGTLAYVRRGRAATLQGDDVLEKKTLPAQAPAPSGAPKEKDEPVPGDTAVIEGVGPVRLADALGRARESIGAALSPLRRRGQVDDAAFEDLEDALILSDVGVPTTAALLDCLREKVRTGGVENSSDGLLLALRQEVVALFSGDDTELKRSGTPSVWLIVGVNGVGKTTTIGKLAHRATSQGETVVLAAGDTFRAAAADQLEIWAERTGSGFIRGAEGADPSSVVFDAVSHAAARGTGLVLADSAGRLHTRKNLMEELKKLRRVADRPPGSVDEVLLVLDATTGQNGLAQAREFTSAIGVTGIVLTKLDGTAKGGIVCAIRRELGLPIKLVGTGEGLEDLVVFDPDEFAAALIAA